MEYKQRKNIAHASKKTSMPLFTMKSQNFSFIKASTTALLLLSASACFSVGIYTNQIIEKNNAITAFPKGILQEEALLENSFTDEETINLELASNKLHITKRENYSLDVITLPDNDTSSITWSSQDDNVAVVSDDGYITPVSNGETEIIVTDELSGEESVCKVKVTLEEVKPEILYLRHIKYTFKGEYGKELELIPTVLPHETEDKSVTWKSSNEKVATVNEKGIVKSVGEGKAVITCSTNNGVTETCEVTVNTPVMVEKLETDYTWIRFTGPQAPSKKLEAVILPENATNKKVKWESTDETVAIVDKNGVVSSVGDGECKITCKTTDGSKLIFTCDIYVENKTNSNYSTDYESFYLPVNPEVASTVIEEAYRYVGVIPYVWGGSDLSTGVDCSGFICAVYDRFGYNLWGSRTDLYSVGIEVPDISQAQAGDILCYRGHVALYDGNGGRIHAPTEGYNVSHDYNISGYYTIRRIIQ